ncbi:MAG TPA: aminopeptidase [Chloroflexi bacterium]|nr:aminopeptidase [Chloroflexota bacterium]
MFEILKALTELPGAVGNEQPVQRFLRERWAPLSQETHADGAGNLIAHVGGRGKKLLITAHADEVSFLIKSISEDGYLFLNSNQLGLRPAHYLYMIGQPALGIGYDGERVEGVFAAATGHATSAAQREQPQREWNDIFVDIGAEDAEEVRARGLDVGCPVIWNPTTRRFGKYFCGKAMDDRLGLAVMDSLLHQIQPVNLQYDLYLASTVQEELGMVGASAVPLQIPLDLVICLEIGLAGDIPTVSERDIPAKLGGGPLLIFKDSYVHYSRNLTLALRRVATSRGMPVQSAVLPSFASDGLQFIRAGIATALLAAPTRYTHSPFEMTHEDDLVAMVDLLHAFLVTDLHIE